MTRIAFLMLCLFMASFVGFLLSPALTLSALVAFWCNRRKVAYLWVLVPAGIQHILRRGGRIAASVTLPILVPLCFRFWC